MDDFNPFNMDYVDYFTGDLGGGFLGDSYVYEPILPDDAFDFENGPFADSLTFEDLLNSGSFTQQQQPGFLERFGNSFLNSINSPMGTAQRAGQQLAGNLRSGAGEAAAIGQGLGIKGQLIAAGASLLGEDAQLNRETNALLRAQQLNQTNLAREANSQRFKANLTGRMNPRALAMASARIYGV